MKHIKIPAFALALTVFAGAFLFKAAAIASSPSGFTSSELEILYSLFRTGSLDLVYLRYFSAFFTSAAAAVVFLFIMREKGDKSLALTVSGVFALSPWSFMLSRSINLYAPLLFCLTLPLLVRNMNTSLLFYMSVVFVFMAATWNRMTDPGFLNGITFIRVLETLDLHKLFFSGEALSATMRMPRTGHFMMVDLLAFFMGSVYLYRSGFWKKHIPYFALLYAGGLMTYFSGKSPFFIFNGAGVLLILSVIVGFGYHYLWHMDLGRVAPFAKVFLALAVAANLFYYQELFYNHFDRKNSTEWGYANTQMAQYLKSHEEIRSINITDKKEDLQRFLKFFMPQVKVKSVRESDLAAVCGDSKKMPCIVKEDELPLLGLDKDKAGNTFYNKGGLPEFFLL
jgi:hypothetical protein